MKRLSWWELRTERDLVMDQAKTVDDAVIRMWALLESAVERGPRMGNKR
jgi:hypothetical protein